jgi:3-hydroxybutyryl-CoA dehydrogenase
MTSTQTIGVIGAGTMGTGIAQVCAVAGLSVVMTDVNDERIARGRNAIADGLERMVKKEKLSNADREGALGRLGSSTDYDALKACDFIIESATENEALKLGILRQVDAVAKDSAILATNTSSISIDKLAAATKRPHSFVGLHFFNPVPVMGLVEIVHGPRTNPSTIDAATAFARRLGKRPVIVKDSPGFVVNRLLCPMLNEAALAFGEGIATAADIDEAMKLGCNHPIGPLALADLIGLDVVLAIMEEIHRDFQDSKYRPAAVLGEMVAAKHLGRKTGRGFYTYEAAK